MAAKIEAIVTEFGQVLTALHDVGHVVAAVGKQAGQVATQAAAIGMTGVGQRMLAIREQIRTIHRALTATAGAGDQVLTALRAVAAATSSGEVVEQLWAIVERLDVLRERMLALPPHLASIKAQVEVTLQGAQPGPLLGRLDAIHGCLVDVVQLAEAVRQRVTLAITAAETLQLGASGESPGEVAPEMARAGPGPSTPVGRSQGRPRRVGGGTPDPDHFNSVAPGYERVDVVDLPEGWMRTRSQEFRPRTAGTLRATAGVYRYRDDIWSDPTAVSSDPRDPSVSQDLDYSRLTDDRGRALRGIPRSARHAEMRAAARMRQDERHRLAMVAQLAERGGTPPARQPRHVDVVLDNSVCGLRGFDQHDRLTCDRLLPGAIPAGDRLTVWGSVDGGQSFFRRTFTGTGSLIR